MKKFLSFLMMAALATVAWAGEVTFDAFGSSNWTEVTAGKVYTMTKDGVTLTVDQNTATTTTLQGLTDAHLRVYKGAQLTVAADYDITSVVFSDINKYLATNFSVDGVALGNDKTWTGSATSVTFDAGAQVRLTKIVVTIADGNDPAVATPVITLDPAAGPYYEGDEVNVSITCATEGATTYYAIDGGEWAEGDNFDLTTSATITAKAVLGEQESAVATKTVTFVAPATTYATLAEVIALDDATEFTYTGTAVVTYVNSTDTRYVWIKDATASTVIFNSGLTVAAGDVLKGGWSGKKTTYNGLIEFTSVTGVETDGTQEVTPAELTLADVTAANQAVYGILRGVKVTETNGKNFTISDGTATAAGYNTYNKGVELPAASDVTVYDIEGIVNYFNNPQFTPIAFTDVTPADQLTVTITPAAGTYTEPVTVTIACNNEDALVTYKVNDGEEKDYTEPFTLYESATVTAYATDGDALVEATAAYTIELAPIAVEFTPAAGTYYEPINVTVAITGTVGEVLAAYYVNGEEVDYTDEGIALSENAIVKVEVLDMRDELAEFTAEYVFEAAPVLEAYYEKVTTTDALTDGQYLIVYEDDALAMNGGIEDNLDVTGNNVAVNFVGKVIEANDDTAAAEFTIAYDAEAEAYTLQGAGGLYIGQTTDANGLKSSAEQAYANAISFDEDGNADIVSEGGAYLRYNFAANQLRFRYYKSSTYANQKPIALYKYVKADALEGDVNGDGSVDVEDVNAVINIILAEQDLKGDVNGDGSVDVEDVNAVINIILAQE